jgi:hypothetical protein
MQRDYEAPEGQIWVCGICGRTAKQLDEIGDTSCFLRAVLCRDDESLIRAETGLVTNASAVA